jgi:hypothetical protein
MQAGDSVQNDLSPNDGNPHWRSVSMLWFFDREDESLRLETRYDNDRSEFVAVVRYPDGRERAERFSTLGDFRKWIGAEQASRVT